MNDFLKQELENLNSRLSADSFELHNTFFNQQNELDCVSQINEEERLIKRYNQKRENIIDYIVKLDNAIFDLFLILKDK